MKIEFSGQVVWKRKEEFTIILVIHSSIGYELTKGICTIYSRYPFLLYPMRGGEFLVGAIPFWKAIGATNIDLILDMCRDSFGNIKDIAIYIKDSTTNPNVKEELECLLKPIQHVPNLHKIIKPF